MQPEIQALCIQCIADEWRKLEPVKLRDKPPIPPPWSMWIRLYDPISPSIRAINDSECLLRKTWFLDEHGVKERDPWEYARFVVVNGYRPWACERFKPAEEIWGHVYHQIGLAAFAAFAGTDDIYLETQWGGTWGQGYRMTVDSKGALQIIETLWRS